ncbi:hypothetical protein Plec18167_007353 [Paecilomyces lecythidis]|uniref:AB hydrolase-1 domain-containing protein n=1 Tax=Paecilomyces lecythidis TaxID=3004212 RepID=A0ABR3X4R0_9EURO
MASESISLTECFTHRSDTYEYSISWTCLGPDNAPPVVFVHGTPWSSIVWESYAKALSSRYRVYIFDRPGFGQSPDRKSVAPTNSETDLDGSLTGQAEAFAALYRSWHFKPDQLPHIIAHDNAGLVTLRANILYDCQYASLCLIDVVAVGPFGCPFFRLVAENKPVFSSIPDSIFQGIILGYIRDASFKPLPGDITDNLLAPWTANGSQGQEGFIRQLLQADQRYAGDIEGRYAEVGNTIPVKVIWGKEDRWIPADYAVKLGRVIGAREVVLVEEAGHLIMFDQPERLATEIGIWLATAAL